RRGPELRDARRAADAAWLRRRRRRDEHGARGHRGAPPGDAHPRDRDRHGHGDRDPRTDRARDRGAGDRRGRARRRAARGAREGRGREALTVRTVDLIEKKRDGAALTAAEIAFLIDGYTAGSIPDYQMAAFCMAVVWRGMDM